VLVGHGYEFFEEPYDLLPRPTGTNGMFYTTLKTHYVGLRAGNAHHRFE
jgi:hypothetical protein